LERQMFCNLIRLTSLACHMMNRLATTMTRIENKVDRRCNPEIVALVAAQQAQRTTVESTALLLVCWFRTATISRNPLLLRR